MGSLSDITLDNVEIVGFEITDLRFPTSLDGVGSDAMHVGTNGSHPYVRLLTNHPGLVGEGIVSPPSSCNSTPHLQPPPSPDPETLTPLSHQQAFSNGRGSELICLALDIFARRVVSKTMTQLTRNMGKTWRYMVSDSQYRWIGPEKSVTHLAVAGVLNAVWDLWGKIAGKPVWRIVCDMTPAEVVRCVDFRYITDVVTPEEAVVMLEGTQKGKEERLREALGNRAVPAYSTSPGWLAFSGDRMKEVLEETIAQGFTVFKFKVGTSVEADRERLKAVRDVLGYDKGYQIMIDANQVSLFGGWSGKGREVLTGSRSGVCPRRLST
jgi:L-galactonate dehydratase